MSLEPCTATAKKCLRTALLSVPGATPGDPACTAFVRRIGPRATKEERRHQQEAEQVSPQIRYQRQNQRTGLNQ